MQLVKETDLRRLDNDPIMIVAEHNKVTKVKTEFPHLSGDNKLWEFNGDTGKCERVFPSKTDMILSNKDIKRGRKVKYFIEKSNCMYVIHLTKVLAQKKLIKLLKSQEQISSEQ